VLQLCLPVVQAATTERPDDELRHILTQAIASSDSFADRFDAEVWLTDMSRRLDQKVADPKERLLILKTAHYEATRAELPPELVLAVIDVESNFDRFAISYAGARGLMQVMPFWLDEIGRPDDDLFDIRTNLRMGCTILRHYLDRERGDRTRALARYNGSVGKTWYPQLVFKALGRRWYRQ
jgi:soluble lytic murein transglycosylase-like protein